MTKAFRIYEHGGPEVLRWEDVEVGVPGPGEARVRHHAVGLNFIDVYHRSGLYKLALPSGIGVEGAGVVEAVGAGVTNVVPGDRVAYERPPGAYSELRLCPAERLVKLPKGIGFEQAAAMMVKGLTVQYLIRRTFRVQSGQVVLLHAAAGGVGLIACQWLKALGVSVIGSVGSESKAELARAHGCAHTIVLGKEDFVARVRELTNGEGVPVVYDSIGKDTFLGSLDCLQPFGTLVTYGNASGPVAPIAPGLLAAKGSLFLTRPSLDTYAAKRADLEAMAADLFDTVLSGKIRIAINQRYPLRDAAHAQCELMERKTTGSTVLLP
ncbi:MAG TPA: quinone oxidoreductase [Burkholderiales bacterium]|jgi:NADPH2:quinone reductase|nr:quinone oxidoreductase [Burkholderiales bacterium]